jgi:hypothetical protein
VTRLHPFKALNDAEIRALGRVGRSRFLNSKTGAVATLLVMMAVALPFFYLAPTPLYGDRRPLTDRIGETVVVGLGMIGCFVWAWRLQGRVARRNGTLVPRIRVEPELPWGSPCPMGLRFSTIDGTTYEVDFLRDRIRALAAGDTATWAGAWRAYSEISPIDIGQQVVVTWPTGDPRVESSDSMTTAAVVRVTEWDISQAPLPAPIDRTAPTIE